MERIDVTIMGPGQNWTGLAGRIAIGLDGYYSRLPAGSTVAVVTADPNRMCFQGPIDVAAGKYHMGITTPAWWLKLAMEGLDPFPKALPLRTLAVFPHDDRMCFAVTQSSQLRSLHDVREQKFPLKVSTPDPTQIHPAVWAAKEILKEYGFSFEDLEKWGGKLLTDRPRFINSPTSQPVSAGFDAVFDEAIMTRRWKRITDENDIKFLPIEPDVMKRLEARGWKAGTLEKGRFRGVEEDIPAIDFSGWALYCRADIDDELAYLTIAAIEEQKEAIEAVFPQPFAALTGPVDMTKIGANPPIPLHPGAEKYYREKGYL